MDQPTTRSLGHRNLAEGPPPRVDRKLQLFKQLLALFQRSISQGLTGVHNTGLMIECLLTCL